MLVLWLNQWRARRRPHFGAEVEVEVRYLRGAYAGEAQRMAQERLARLMPGSFKWCVLKAAIQRLRGTHDCQAVDQG